jgi:hypothetical protein
MGGEIMKITIIKKEQDITETPTITNVTPNIKRKGKKMSTKAQNILHKRDEESREKSADKRKKEKEILPGHYEMKQLARGIMEYEFDNLDPLDQLIEEVLSELKIVLERKKVPQCGVGNPVHNSLGQFSSKNTSGGSWSIRNAEGPKCSHGQTKYDKGKRKFTRVVCGRQDHKDAGVKADHRCYDGKKIKEDIEENDSWIKIRKSALDALLTELDVEPLIDEDKNDRVSTFCSSRGHHSIKQWLQHTNALQRAEDGDLLDEPKKTKSK